MTRWITIMSIMMLTVSGCSLNARQQAPKAPAQKAWDAKYGTVFTSPDGIRVGMQPYLRPPTAAEVENSYRERTQATKEQILASITNPTTKAFLASTGSREHNIKLNFLGECSKLVKVDIHIVDTRTFNYGNYEQSRNIADLPIHKELKAMRGALLEQCAELAGIRVFVHITHLGRAKPVQQGVMLASNDWKITDGSLVTKVDEFYEVDISFKSGALFVQHRGRCQKDPTMEINRDTNKGSMLSGAISVDEYHNVTGAISIEKYYDVAVKSTALYVRECPGTNSVAYKIAALPRHYVCKDPARCIVAEEYNGWNHDRTTVVLDKASLARENEDGHSKKKNYQAPKFSKYEESLVRDDSKKIQIPAVISPPTTHEIKLAMLREHDEFTNKSVDFDTGQMRGEYFGGEYVTNLESVSNPKCAPVTQGYKCSFVLKGEAYFTGGGGAAILKALTPTGVEKTEATITRLFILTDKGWRSPDERASITRQKGEFLQKIGEGFKAGGCAVAPLDSLGLPPPECRR